MNESAALREPLFIFAVASLAIAVVLLTAIWAALFRRSCVWMPVGASVLVGLAYTLFPDLRTFSIAWDVLFLLAINVAAIYAIASFAGTVIGDALHRREQQAHAEEHADSPNEGFAPPKLDEEDDDEDIVRRPRPPWLSAFRGCWYRPGPV